MSAVQLQYKNVSSINSDFALVRSLAIQLCNNVLQVFCSTVILLLKQWHETVVWSR